MRENHKKILGVYPQVTHISAAIYHKLQNFARDQNLDIFLFIFLFYRQLPYLNIHTY